eukprot:168334-Chlamydomonas_euryale.AAC.2
MPEASAARLAEALTGRQGFDRPRPWPGGQSGLLKHLATGAERACRSNCRRACQASSGAQQRSCLASVRLPHFVALDFVAC